MFGITLPTLPTLPLHLPSSLLRLTEPAAPLTAFHPAHASLSSTTPGLEPDDDDDTLDVVLQSRDGLCFRVSACELVHESPLFKPAVDAASAGSSRTVSPLPSPMLTPVRLGFEPSPSSPSLLASNALPASHTPSHRPPSLCGALPPSSGTLSPAGLFSPITPSFPLTPNSPMPIPPSPNLAAALESSSTLTPVVPLPIGSHALHYAVDTISYTTCAHHDKLTPSFLDDCIALARDYHFPYVLSYLLEEEADALRTRPCVGYTLEALATQSSNDMSAFPSVKFAMDNCDTAVHRWFDTHHGQAVTEVDAWSRHTLEVRNRRALEKLELFLENRNESLHKVPAAIEHVEVEPEGADDDDVPVQQEMGQVPELVYDDESDSFEYFNRPHGSHW